VTFHETGDAGVGLFLGQEFFVEFTDFIKTGVGQKVIEHLLPGFGESEDEFQDVLWILSEVIFFGQRGNIGDEESLAVDDLEHLSVVGDVWCGAPEPEDGFADDVEIDPTCRVFEKTDKGQAGVGGGIELHVKEDRRWDNEDILVIFTPELGIEDEARIFGVVCQGDESSFAVLIQSVKAGDAAWQGLTDDVEAFERGVGGIL